MSQIELWWLMERGQYSYLESKSYRQLQILAKSNKIKAHGTKYQLITRINQNFNDGDTLTAAATTPTKITTKELKKVELPTVKTTIKLPTKKIVVKNTPIKKTDKQTTNNNNINPKWYREGSISYYYGETITRKKIAGFDMDSTLISNKSGKVHAVDKNDWVWWNECVPSKLRSLYNDQGYQIVIFTNQGGIGDGSKFDITKHNQITQKINILEQQLQIPLIAFIAQADDQYRKPNGRLWEIMKMKNPNNTPLNDIDINQSFYCGDAAGRPDGWKFGAKKDFSNTDYGFSLSIGIRFETPETFFLGEAPYQLENGDNVTSLLIPKAPTIGNRFEGEITTKEFEVVVSTGYPASGKSTFAKKYFGPAGYVIVNQDTLKTKDKCIKAVEDALKQGKSVIVDNTNGTIEIRSEYIKLANRYKASTRSLNFTTSKEIAEHLNYYRERTQGVKHIPSMVYNIFSKNFVEPSTNEGFKSVTKINFVLELEEKDKQKYYIPNPKAKPMIRQ